MTNLPQRIANYKMDRRIGKGGMSEVWLARHRSLEDRLVAIKLLLSQDAEWIDRFTREATITSRLRHEFIVQIYDHGYQAPYHYTVMEYVVGGALREVLKNGQRLSLDQALHVFRCAGTALDYAHSHGIIHRDVSPGNILLEQGSGRVLLTDFGIARESGKVGVTTINKVMGTPGYLSPEHASSATAVTHLSDIYGLGIVLFEMLSGRLPWDYHPGLPDSGGGPFAPPKTLQECGVQGLPNDVDRVIQTMLALDPSKRYPSALAAIEDLDAVLKRHTSPTQVLVPAGQPGAPAAPAITIQSPTVIDEPHPVETVLGPDLLKGPMQEARKRAEAMRDPRELGTLLNQWSDQGRFRRRLLGRQAQIHRITSTNVYFYTLRVLYETREQPKTIEEPDYKTAAVPLEKELDQWGLTLPPPKDFTDEPGGAVTLPGTLRVVNCGTCKGVGKVICPRCKGERRIKREQQPQPQPQPQPQLQQRQQPQQGQSRFGLPTLPGTAQANKPPAGTPGAAPLPGAAAIPGMGALGGPGAAARPAPGAAGPGALPGALPGGLPGGLPGALPPQTRQPQPYPSVNPALPPQLIPCPECSGTGGIACKTCDKVGRLVQKKVTVWRRSAGVFQGNDDLPRVDEKWLQTACTPSEVYRERHAGGLRPQWQAVPALAALTEQAQAGTNANTRIAMSELRISFIPVTEILFDLGEQLAITPANKPTGKGADKPAADASADDNNLYRWHIYGFERRLPNDWRFLNWDRVNAIILAVASVVLLLLLVASLLVRST